MRRDEAKKSPKCTQTTENSDALVLEVSVCAISRRVAEPHELSVEASEVH